MSVSKIIPLATISLLPLSYSCSNNTKDTTASSPNIVLFLVDDMGIMDTEVPFLTNGQGQAVSHPLNDWYRTPGMKRLSEQGVRFSTFYAQSVSSPTRASLMTGQNATRHKTTNWINSESNNKTPYGPTNWNWDGIKANDVTLPCVLRDAGYRTIHVGKAHFGHQDSEGENPANIGFDVNIAGSSIGHPGSYYGEHGYGHIKGQKHRAVPGLEQYHGTNTFLTEALTLEAKREISASIEADTPFFLYMSHYAVHDPFQSDPRFADNYADSDKSPRAQAFATLIEGMDKSLNDLLDYLEELGIADNTLILFMGDNGSDAPLGDVKGHYSSAPLRGKKGTEYEGGTRTPLIIAWAKPDSNNHNQQLLHIEQGAIQEQMATVMDIYPTVLQAAGTNNPQGHTIDGYQLKTQLSGKYNNERSNTFLMHFPHEHHGSYFTTYRNGDWKIIYWYNPENPESPNCELYNLASDPFEMNNVANIELETKDRLMREMAKQLEHEGALYPEDADGNILKPQL